MSKEKILIIEDDVDLLDIEQFQLEGVGYEVRTAQGISEAIQLISKEKFDCILLDMNLHGTSGTEVIIFTRKPEEINYNTPIIIVSGDLNIEAVREVREKINTVLVKPFSSSDLIDKIKMVIAKSNLVQNSEKSGTAKKIFIVDDDKEYVKELKNFLESESFQVVISTNTQEACLKLQKQRFDIILADLDIDHRSGEWLVNLMRRDSAHVNNKTPVIIVSGFMSIGSPRLKDMVQNFVEKPISLMSLIEAIKNEISQSPYSIVKSV